MDKINDMHYGSNSFTFQKAIELRKRMTKSEIVLWEELKNKQFIGLKFRRQHPINRFIVDFYCHKYKLIIELDGSIHNVKEVEENDKKREEELRDFGLNILRFTNDEVLYNTKETLLRIAQFINSVEENSGPLFHPLGLGEKKSGGEFS